MKLKLLRTQIGINKHGGHFNIYIYPCKCCGDEMRKLRKNTNKFTGYCRKCFIKETRLKNKIINGIKKCLSCNVLLPIKKFATTKYGGVVARCIRCSNIKRFGITEAEYLIILKSQNGKCAICKKNETEISAKTKLTQRLSIDHSHKTNKIRGILCSKCNRGIGQFNDDIKILKNTVKYLQKFNE